MDDIEYSDGATPLDPDELEGLKFSHVATRGELDHLEAANISQGFMWLNRKRNPQILTDTFVREFHKQLFGEVWSWAGVYRKTEKNIGVDPLQISIKVRELIDDVQYWIDNQVFDPLEVAVRFHHKLVFIHPFANGNGRHARYMADAIMEKVFKQPPINWGNADGLKEIREIRKQYIKALQKADAGIYDDLLTFIKPQTLSN